MNFALITLPMQAFIITNAYVVGLIRKKKKNKMAVTGISFARIKDFYTVFQHPPGRIFKIVVDYQLRVV